MSWVTIKSVQSWKKRILILAGVYHIICGAFEIIFPNFLFQYLGIEAVNYTPVWQAIGLFLLVFGIGYLVASRDPNRHWPMVLMGFLFSLLGLIGDVFAIVNHNLPFDFAMVLLFNELIWIVPFGWVLYDIYHSTFKEDAYLIDLFCKQEEISIDMFETSDGMNLEEMSHKWPVLVVFLRHFGCTFCRETLEDIKQQRNNIELQGTRIVLVHMSDDHTAAVELQKYQLEDLAHISDPECILYKMFHLKKGSWLQILGLKVLIRGFVAGLLKGHGLGKQMGDVTQMPGVFMFHKGKIISKFVHHTAADRPNYIKIASCNA